MCHPIYVHAYVPRIVPKMVGGLQSKKRCGGESVNGVEARFILGLSSADRVKGGVVTKSGESVKNRRPESVGEAKRNDDRTPYQRSGILHAVCVVVKKITRA